MVVHFRTHHEACSMFDITCVCEYILLLIGYRCVCSRNLSKTCRRTSAITCPIFFPLVKTLVHLDPTKHGRLYIEPEGRFQNHLHWATDHILRAGSLVFEIHMTLKDSLQMPRAIMSINDEASRNGSFSNRET